MSQLRLPRGEPPPGDSVLDSNAARPGAARRSLRFPRLNSEFLMSKPTNLRELRESGWQSKTVKREIHDNFVAMLPTGEELFPGIIGYDDTVIPEINLGLIAGHDMLFSVEKGQAKSRLMRALVAFLDPEIPYIDHPRCTHSRRPVGTDQPCRSSFVAEHARRPSPSRGGLASTLCRTARSRNQVRRHYR